MNHVPLIPAHAGIQGEYSAVTYHFWVPAFRGDERSKLTRR
jgi:hypothetical protein